MRVCAVICEYNPFHLGHAYHLRAAREASGADYVLCLMSGALTQRGAFARHDKWLRARAALENGADVVLELPARFACSPAPDFAGGGVALLAALGVVTHLSFGCEPSALPLLSAAASLFKSESPDFSAALQRSLADGLPYPRARALAAEQLAEIPADLLAQPNAALALEYLQALPETIVPIPIARRGSGYHDASLSALSSATAVRAALARGGLTAALAAGLCLNCSYLRGVVRTHHAENLDNYQFFVRTIQSGLADAVQPGDLILCNENVWDSNADAETAFFSRFTGRDLHAAVLGTTYDAPAGNTYAYQTYRKYGGYDLAWCGRLQSADSDLMDGVQVYVQSACVPDNAVITSKVRLADGTEEARAICLLDCTQTPRDANGDYLATVEDSGIVNAKLMIWDG